MQLFIFKHSKFVFQSFKKTRSKILEVTNDDFYNGVKSQYKLLHILGYTKMTNSGKFYSEQCPFEYYKISQILSFSCSLLQFYCTSSPPPTAARCCLHPCTRVRLPRCSSSRRLGQHLSHRLAAPHAAARPAPCRRRSAAAAPHRLRLLAPTAVASPLHYQQQQHLLCPISISSFSSAALPRQHQQHLLCPNTPPATAASPI